MDEVIDSEPKLVIKHLTNALQPPAFRECIKARLQREQYGSYTKDVVMYFAWITEQLTGFIQWAPKGDVRSNTDNYGIRTQASNLASRSLNHSAKQNNRVMRKRKCLKNQTVS